MSGSGSAEGPLSLSAGIVPVFCRAPPLRDLFLVLRAYTYWDFPKGGVSPGEDPLDAALRELREETTLSNAELRWGRDFLETAPYARGKVARYYVAEVPDTDVSLPVNPYLGRPEHHEFRWVTYQEARDLLSPRVQSILDWARAKIEAPADAHDNALEAAGPDAEAASQVQQGTRGRRGRA